MLNYQRVNIPEIKLLGLWTRIFKISRLLCFLNIINQETWLADFESDPLQPLTMFGEVICFSTSARYCNNILYTVIVCLLGNVFNKIIL